MPAPHTLSLIHELANAEGRFAVATRVAHHLGAEVLLIFIRDAELGILVPAPGFPQTVPGGPTWDDFFSSCREPGLRRTELAYPDVESRTPSVAYVGGDGTVFALLGGQPALPDPAELALPLLGALLRAEQKALSAAGEADASREAAGRASRVTVALDAARVELQRALRVKEESLAHSERLTQQLRDSELQFELLADSIPQLAWAAQPDGHIDWYNRPWYEYTGTTFEQMQGWGWKSVHDPALLDDVVRRWISALAVGVPFEMEFPLRRADGVFRWHLTRAVPLRDERGRILRWFGTNTDVDDAMRATVERTRLFMEAPAAIALLRGPTFVITLANRRIREAWGRTADIIGLPLFEALPEIRGQGFEELLVTVLRTGSSHVGNEIPAQVYRNGRLETVYFNCVYSATRDAAGALDGVAVFAFDVTPQVIARERATLGANVGRALVVDAPLSVQLRLCCEALVGLGAALARIWTYNLSSRVLELRASSGMYTHIDGAHGRIPLGAQKVGRIAQSRQPYMTNGVVGDAQVPDQEWAKREGLVAFAGYPLVVGDRLVGVMAMFAKHELSSDTLATLASVADQVALGIERDNSERFRELFIGMLGHDLRNPLNAVTIATHLLLSSKLDAQPRRTLERIESSTERMTRMITQVLDFTRARSGGGIPIVRRSANLHAICAQAIDELISAHPERKVEAAYFGDGAGEWDGDRLAQVFSNIVGNALAYGAADTPVRVVIDATGNDVRCSVHNMGTPIHEALLPVLFDPFRRAVDATTSKTQGLGLGLFISQQIVIAHGGTVSVQSGEFDGTRFSIVLLKSLPVENET